MTRLSIIIIAMFLLGVSSCPTKTPRKPASDFVATPQAYVAPPAPAAEPKNCFSMEPFEAALSKYSDPKYRNWIKQSAELAIYFQAKTGMPASVMVAQNAQEGGYKISSPYIEFGLICSKGSGGFSREFEFKDGTKTQFQTGSCKTVKTKSGKVQGHFRTYPSYRDSFVHYIQNLFESGYYDSNVLKVIPENFPPPASPQDVLHQMDRSNYCDPDMDVPGKECNSNGMTYAKTLKSIMNSFNLGALDTMDICDKTFYARNNLPEPVGGAKANTATQSGTSTTKGKTKTPVGEAQ